MVKNPRSRDASDCDPQDLSVYYSTPVLCNSNIYSEPLRHMPSLKFVFFKSFMKDCKIYSIKKNSEKAIPPLMMINSYMIESYSLGDFD